MKVNAAALSGGFRDKVLKALTLMIYHMSQVVHLAVDLHADLIEVPAPMSNAPHPAHPLPAEVSGEHRTEAVPPELSNKKSSTFRNENGKRT